MDQIQTGYVRTDLSASGIAHIIFYHPDHNSLPSALLAQLSEAIAAAGANAAVKVVVLRSAEHKTFCAGASFDELMAISDAETGQRFFAGFGKVINAMRRCPKIIIARIHGRAVGGGVGLAAAADFSVASMYASIRLSELAVGFGPFVIGPAVERKIGVAAYSQMSLTPGDWQTAAWGKEKGLFQEVFEGIEQVDAYIEHLCKNLCAYSPEALRELKTVFWQGTEHWDQLLDERAAISGRLALSDAARAAMAAFKAR